MLGRLDNFEVRHVGAMQAYLRPRSSMLSSANTRTSDRRRAMTSVKVFRR